MTTRYWDSNAFLGWLNQVPSQFGILDSIIQDGRASRVRLVTSTVTYAEVFYTNASPTDAQVTAIKELFGQSWIVPVQLDRPTAELARELLFVFAKNDGLKPPDAIHLASALQAKALGGAQCFDTFDRNLKHLGTQLHRVAALKNHEGIGLRVGPPTGQLTLSSSQTASIER